jgi:hypothetical protein
MTIFTFFYNLFSILKKAPAIISIVKALIDVIGSQQVQTFLESFRDALKKEVPTPDNVPVTEPERLRLLDRVRKNLSLGWLGMRKSDYVTYCRFIGIDEETVNS